MYVPTGFDEREAITIPLPSRAATMSEVIAFTGQRLADALQEYPMKRGQHMRWITTGKIDFRPAGSVTYYVSYQERLGFGD